MSRRTVAYVMSRFPHLPETFILREMAALESQGWTVVLYPLICQEQAVVHAEARAWIPRARRLPYLSRSVGAANASAVGRHPLRYALIWATVVRTHLRQPAVLVRALALLPKTFLAARLMTSEGVDRVHAHYATYPALAAWVIGRMTGLRYSVTVHAHDLYMGTPMLPAKLDEAEHVIAISRFNRNFIQRNVGAAAAAKTQVVHCGIIPDLYAHADALPDPGQRLEILSVGSLQIYKGHVYLVRACRLLVDRGVRVRCRIVGGGPERDRLEAEIASLGLGGTVELLGAQPQEEVARLLPTAHCYVQPSVVAPSGQMEGIPVSLMEALASRLPVVATDISGVGELVRPDETGWLVPPERPEAIAGAIQAILADRRRAVRIAEAGHALVRREYDLTTNVRRLAALLEATPSQPAAGGEGRP